MFGALASVDFDPDTSAWEHLIQMPIPRSELSDRRGPQMFCSPAGALVLLSGLPPVPHRLLAFWNNEATSATLLADTKWENREQELNPTLRALMNLTPQWAWPKEFDLDTSFFLVEGKSLWILTPRKIWTGAGTGLRGFENAQFSDDRQATLFHFVPEMSVPFSAPIRFQSSNPAFDPLDPTQHGITDQSFSRTGNGFVSQRLLWLDTPGSLVLASAYVRGHWRIPKSSLEARFSTQKESLTEKARMAASQTNRPAGTNAVQP